MFVGVQVDFALSYSPNEAHGSPVSVALVLRAQGIYTDKTCGEIKSHQFRESRKVMLPVIFRPVTLRALYTQVEEVRCFLKGFSSELWIS